MYQHSDFEQNVALYRKYVQSIRPFAPDWIEPETDAIWERIVKEYMDDPFTDWVRVCADGVPVGFLIVCRKGGDCHPDADYTIGQTFVSEGYRRMGLMKRAVVEYVESHPKGIYCYDILKGNDGAESFWNIIFTEALAAKRVYLPEIRGHMERKYVNLYGYKVR